MTPPPPEKLMAMLAANTVMFALLALVFWGIEAAWRKFVRRDPSFVPRWVADDEERRTRPEAQGTKCAIWFAVRKMPAVLGIALALSITATLVARWCGFDLQSQDMLKWLIGDTYTMKVKVAVIVFALLEAPILEELVFRRFIFRAIYRRCGALWLAMILSGCVFALAHLNALVFVPLVFLGGAFSWIYWRTGRIIAPMFAHFLFNAANVALLFTFPEMA